MIKMKTAELIEKIFSAPNCDFMKEKHHVKGFRHIYGNSFLGFFLAAEAYALQSGHVPDYKDAIVCGTCYAGDRVKNKITDMSDGRIDKLLAALNNLSSYANKK